jgi:hypothetical protein
MGPLDFLFNLPDPSGRTMALGFTQLLTVMKTTKLPGGKARQAHKVLPTVSRLSRKCGSLDEASTACYRVFFFYIACPE